MWQTPNQKARGPSKKSGSSRSKRPLHLKRVTAELRSVGARTQEGEPEIQAQARLMLNDLLPTGVGLFSTRPFVAGQEVAIMLTTPTMIYLRGRVAFCQERDLGSHIISEVPYSYQIGIVFVFETPAEKAAVAKYCEGVAAACAPKPGMAKAG